MIGDRIRALREKRCWTQAHLAEASGVSLRTIQRLERLHSCSAETLLALGAALGVDVRDISSERSALAHPAEPRAWRWLTPLRSASWGAMLALPACLFVAVNLLKYGAGIAGPYDMLAAAGHRLGLVAGFEAVSPILFIGGTLGAAVLTLASQVRPQVDIRGGSPALTALSLRFNPWSSAILLCALAALAALGAYLIGETITTVPRAAAH
jgi:transcriptional regulator with XRE-family HTH domain